MTVSLDRNKSYRSGRLFVCLVFAVVMFMAWGITGFCEEEMTTLNSSGNVNRHLLVDPTEVNDGYSAVVYDIKNGLPTSEANAIAQTSDGFIWVGSYAGLMRYDGNDFERLDYATGISNVRCFYVDQLDRLWAGTNDNGLYFLDNGEHNHFGKAEGLPSASIRDLTEGTDGTMYVASTKGISMIDRELNISAIEDERIDGQTISVLRSGSDGTIYGITVSGDLFTIRDNKVETYIDADDFPFGGSVAVMPDPMKPSSVYIGTDHYLCHGSFHDSFDTWEKWDVSPLLSILDIEYIDGHIWLCSRTGVGKMVEGSVHLIENLPMNSTFDHMMTDSEGNLWITSTRQGVMKIVVNQFKDLFEKTGLEHTVVNATCLHDGMLFIGTEEGLIVLQNGKKQEKLPLTKAVTAGGDELEVSDLIEYLDGIRIRSIIHDPQDRIWFGTARNCGAICYDDGEITVFTDEDGLLSMHQRSMAECSDGSIIVGSTNGINVIRQNRVTESYGLDYGLPVSLILTVTEGFNHEILAGSDGGGLYIITKDGLKVISTEDGLGSDIVLRVKKSTRRNIYWVVTGNTVAMLTPDFKLTTLKDFPYNNNYDVFESERGDLWVLGSSGIYVLPDEYFEKDSSAIPLFFGIENGLPYVSTVNSTSELTADGDLYMSGNEGVVLVNIDKPLEGIGEIRIVLPYIDADDTRIFPDEEGNFYVPGNAQKLTIYPYVLNYSLINPQVIFKLEGFETKEAIVTKSDLSPVTYTNLSVGTYKFVMKVIDPLEHSDINRIFTIVKGRQVSIGTAGSVIMDFAALFFLAGILVFTTLNRKRARVDDKLFFAMIVTVMLMSVLDGASYSIEEIIFPLARRIMIIENTLFYAGVQLFPFMYLMYLDYRVNRDTDWNAKKNILYSAPCFIMLFVLLANLKTRWIFWVGEDNAWHPGSYDEVLMIPLIIYFALILFKLSKINRNYIVLGITIVAARILSETLIPYISITSFLYALIIVSTHICVISKELIEEPA